MNKRTYSAKEAQEAVNEARQMITAIICPDCLQRHYAVKIDLTSGAVVLYANCPKSFWPRQYQLGFDTAEVRRTLDSMARAVFHKVACTVSPYTIEQVHPLNCRTTIQPKATAVEANGEASFFASHMEVNMHFSLESENDMEVRPILAAMESVFEQCLHYKGGVLAMRTEADLFFGAHTVSLSSKLPNDNNIFYHARPRLLIDRWKRSEFWQSRNNQYHYHTLLRLSKVFQALSLVGLINQYKSDDLLGYGGKLR